MSVPDILGFRLDEALRILTDEGWEATVTTTYPPRRENIPEAGPRRVLRVRRTGERTLDLVTAYEGADLKL